MATLRQSRAQGSERSWDQVQQWIKMGGASFPSSSPVVLSANGKSEVLQESGDYASLVKSNGIVYACMAVRQRVFSQIVWRYVGVNQGKLGNLFGTPALDILSKPWPGGTTGDLARRMIADADNKGAFYGVRSGGRIYPRDPNHMSIVLTGDPAEDEFVDIAGFVYRPNGKSGPQFTYEASEVAYWMPHLNVEPWQPTTWITPVLREIRADNAATDHKASFFANAGTPQMVVKTPESVMTQEQFDEFKSKMDNAMASAGKNATLYLVPGVDVEVVGKDFVQMDFANTQGRDETRIASAAGIPAVILGLKESLAGSSLNQGNYGAARRQFADITMHDLYMSAAGALEVLAPPPNATSKLWFDISQVPFFHEERIDAAGIQEAKARTIKTLTDAAFKPDSIVSAVELEDFTLLEHTGLSTVQVQPTTPPGGNE